MANKTIMFLIFIILTIISGCGKKDETKLNKKQKAKYTAYYFHPTARCESCINLENFTKELLDYNIFQRQDSYIKN